MDIPIHNQILWRACQVAAQRLAHKPNIGDPRAFYPILVRGSWMNDTNQASLFLDTVASSGDLPEKQKIFFRNLWVDEQNGVLNVLQRIAAADVVARARKAAEDAQHTDDFSKYQALDHLDVVKEDADKEYKDFEKAENRSAAKTVRDSMTFYVPDKLLMSTVKKSAIDRLDTFRLTELGRALHTVADFYSHSNYVELLLWSSAFRKELSPELIRAFERGPSPFGDDDERERPRYRLPIGASDFPVNDGFMWYGATPDATPLVSALFTSDDTAHSLLEMYATHLETSDGEVTVDELDLVLSTFQVPGKPIAKAVFQFYREATEVLADIGRKARTFLVKTLANTIAGASDKARETVEPVIKLMEHYDSRKASDWAKAGKYRYLVHVIDTQLAKKLKDQDFFTPQLAHHSLLAKDHPHGDRMTLIRHHMACALAVEATAAILEWHFGADNPTNDRYAALSAGCFIHPVHQLENEAVLAGASVDALAKRVAITDWFDLDYEEELLKWRV